nr:uncharacterized protein LOC116434154 [Nomia melanderi]
MKEIRARSASAHDELDDFNHPTPLHPDVLKHLKPIYEEFSKEDLLTRCLGGRTQNCNESFNSIVWRLNPKYLNSGAKIIEISAFITAGIFNEGYSSVLKIMNALNIYIGQQCKFFVDTYDAQRITRQKRRRQSSIKEARISRRMHQMEQNEFFEDTEGLSNDPDIAD